MTESFDAVVIGGGAGGLCSAVRLADQGRRVLLLEQSQHVGGRFSTIEVDGFKLPTGAVAIEIGGVFQETFDLVGVPMKVRQPEPPVVIHVRGKDLRPGNAVWNHMAKRVTKAAASLASGLRVASDDPADSLTVEAWVRRYTRSETLLSLFQSLSASIFTVNADELPMAAFVRLMRVTGGYKQFGFAPNGNIVLAEGLARAVQDRDGDVRRGWTTVRIDVINGRVAGVRACDPDGREHSIAADVVVSNIGPRGTRHLIGDGVADEAFAARLRDVQPTSMLALAFASREELVEHPGIWTFTSTKRLCNLANLTATCPELAPDGWHLYEAYSVPKPSVGGQFDVRAEKELLEDDLRKMIPGFNGAKEVLFKALGPTVPAQQCRPGYDPVAETPVPGLYDCGDGVKPFGWIGTTACAEIAKNVIDAIVRSDAVASAN